jgi:hypothetical protein
MSDTFRKTETQKRIRRNPASEKINFMEKAEQHEYGSFNVTIQPNTMYPRMGCGVLIICLHIV